jgi:molybdenum cofactor cytidylyltransferase
MGHSIAYGVRSHQSWQGWMIALADMPNIDLILLQALLKEIRKNSHDIIRPASTLKEKIKPGHPVYFPKKYGYALSKLTSDEGAKSIIKTHRLLTRIDSTAIDKYNLIDIDTPSDLDKFRDNSL